MTYKPSRLTALAGAASGAAALTFASFGPALAAMEPKGLRVIAELVSKPDSADDLRKLLVPFALGARNEPGCLQYVLLEIQGDPGHFLTYEVWVDRPALDAHMKAPALFAAGPKLTPLLAKPFTQLFLDALT